MDGFVVQHMPMEQFEEGSVLRLDMRQKNLGAVKFGGADSEFDEGATQAADTAIGSGDRETRAPPESRRGLMDTDGADHIIRVAEQAGRGGEQQAMIVDLIAVVTLENLLLLAKDFTAQRVATGFLVGGDGLLDAIFARRKEFREGEFFNEQGHGAQAS
jgi:hypothetical protein